MFLSATAHLSQHTASSMCFSPSSKHTGGCTWQAKAGALSCKQSWGIATCVRAQAQQTNCSTQSKQLRTQTLEFYVSCWTHSPAECSAAGAEVRIRTSRGCLRSWLAGEGWRKHQKQPGKPQQPQETSTTWSSTSWQKQLPPFKSDHVSQKAIKKLLLTLLEGDNSESTSF